MNPLLQRLPFEQDFELDAANNVVNRRPQPGEQPLYTTADHREKTYAVIGLFPGLRPEWDIMVLTAHSEPGILAAVGQVTCAESARALVQRMGLGRPGAARHYQVLLQVAADRGEPAKTEYVAHHSIGAHLR